MIEHRAGDVLSVPERPVVLAHVVNDQGRWGAGFSGQLSRRWPYARTSYIGWMERGPDFGAVSVVVLEAGVRCAHLLAQRGCPGFVDYPALYTSLTGLSALLDAHLPLTTPVAMPRLGCGLGRGSWARVEPLVVSAFPSRPVIVYTPSERGDHRTDLTSRETK